jgi:branched-chain amino acid aminotransferase
MLNPALLPPKPAEPIIFVNGEFLPDSQAKISVLDHGLMYGDGVFDALCGRNGFIFQLDPHLDRLYRGVHALKLDRWLRMPKEEMRRNVIETVYRNVVTDFYIKVLITRGISPHPVIDPRRCAEASVVIYARPTQFEVTPEKKEAGIRIKPLSIRRVPHDSLDPKVKSLNYLNIVMGKLEAWDAGYDEAVLLDHQGFVCECPGFNIMGISGNRLFTPSHGILVGITRASVMEMAREMGLQVEEGFYSVYDFTEADEVFMTNTVAGVAPVTNIDGWTIGSGKPGPYTRKFQEIYLGWLESGKHGTQVFPEAWNQS